MSLAWLLAIKHGQPDGGDITRFYCNITCIVKNDYFKYYFALIMDSHDAKSTQLCACIETFMSRHISYRHTHTHTHTHTHAHTRTHVHTNVWACIYVYVCWCSYVRACVYVCVCAAYIIRNIALKVPTPCDWPMCSLVSTCTLYHFRENEASIIEFMTQLSSRVPYTRWR